MAQDTELVGDPIVAFDFDGTLTTRDSFTAFLRWRTPPTRWILGGLRLVPAALSYIGHRDRGRIKAAAVREFLRGVTRERLESDARRFAELHSRSLLRPDAVMAWKRWREERVRLVIVTASPDIVVAPFARGLGADDVIGTRLPELSWTTKGCASDPGLWSGPGAPGCLWRHRRRHRDAGRGAGALFPRFHRPPVKHGLRRNG
jgi:phosphatidylglycerophosphatase C